MFSNEDVRKDDRCGFCLCEARGRMPLIVRVFSVISVGVREGPERTRMADDRLIPVC
jgi:hypothetical protein